AILDSKHPEYAAILKDDEVHRSTMKRVIEVLTAKGIKCIQTQRGPGEKFDVNEEIVVAVGGDGTFLDASHSVLTDVPMLGVNSAPHSSHGHFCLATADSFEPVFDEVLSGKRQASRLLRLHATMDGADVPIPPVLNEIMIAHNCPAGTTKFDFRQGTKSRTYMCGGLIVSTPSGSTGMNRSEKGTVLPIADNKFLYLERAPVIPPSSTRKRLSGSMQRGETLEITSKMKGGWLFIDGAHLRHPLKRGGKLVIKAHAHDLIAFVDPACHDKYKSRHWLRRLLGLPASFSLQGHG
ncbi:MAG: NAD(+)/NADH kinase, partial [Cyanobacteria bacterium]|nr:NAD(+)/NADH kinase [Cyanobacteriota bacterium]